MAISTRATDAKTTTRLKCSIPSSHDDAGALACIGDLRFSPLSAQGRGPRSLRPKPIKSIPLIRAGESLYSARIIDCLGRDILSAQQMALQRRRAVSFHRTAREQRDLSPTSRSTPLLTALRACPPAYDRSLRSS